VAFAAGFMLWAFRTPTDSQTVLRFQKIKCKRYSPLGVLALSCALSALARRDWGHAKDYVEMQWLMPQQDQPEDFVNAAAAERGMEPPRPANNLAGRQRSPSRKWCGR
jgi:hypothetical protein